MAILTPAPRSVETTSGISGLRGSTIATKPTKVNPDVASPVISASKIPSSGFDLISLPGATFLANKMHLLPCDE